MSSYRPVEQLHQLLVYSQGFDSEAVQSFFKLHKVRWNKNDDNCDDATLTPQ